MNYKALAAGAVLGFLMAVAPACGGGEEACGTSNCAGCCDADGKCVDTGAQTVEACGSSGIACVACAANQTCTAGACTLTTNPQPDGGGSSCAQTCAGCCITTASGSEICLPGNETTNCGSAGGACQQCTTSQICSDQGTGNACNTPGAVTGIGSACGTDADCSAIGANAICKKTTTLDAGVYVNGFCTLKCSSNAQCGANAYCLPVPPDRYGEEDVICWPRCDGSGGGCRADTNADGTPAYACYTVGNNGEAACWINPLPTYTGPYNIGTACTDNTQCQPPAGGQCLTEADTGFPGGLCTADCIQNPTVCGSEGVCLCLDGQCTQGACFGGCDAPRTRSTCRSQYTCTPLNGVNFGFCDVDCTVTGCGTDAGMACNATTGFCETAPDAGA